MYDAMMATISINRRQLLGDCLESLFKSVRAISFHVCVLDNGSTDGTADMVRTRFPQTDLIQHGERRGFTANMNDLVERFSRLGRYWVMLNNDTQIHPGALDLLIKFMDEHPEAAAASPRLIYPDGRPQMAGMPFPTMLKEVWRFSALSRLASSDIRKWVAGKGQKILGRRLNQYFRNFTDTSEPWEVDFAAGTCLAIRRQALEEVGALSADYVMYVEDIDWCKRARLRGWKIFVVPEAVVDHYGKQSFTRLSLVEYERSLLIFFRKYGAGRLRLYLYRLGMSVLAAIKLAVVAVAPRSSLRGLRRTDWVQGYAQVIRCMVRGR